MQQIINCLALEPSSPRPDGLPPPSLVVPYLITSPTDKSTNTIDKIDPTNTNNKTMMIPWPFIWYSSLVDIPFNTNNDDEDDDIMVVCDNWLSSFAKKEEEEDDDMPKTEIGKLISQRSQTNMIQQDPAAVMQWVQDVMDIKVSGTPLYGWHHHIWWL